MKNALHALGAGQKMDTASALVFPSFSLCGNTAASETFISLIYVPFEGP